VKQRQSGHPRAKRSLGQNFLVDREVIHRILDTVAAGSDESILEIGPGQGALTTGLIQSGARVKAVEYDRDLAAALKEEWKDETRFQLYEEDILRFDWSPLFPLQQIVGNLPYNISSQILIKLYDSPLKPRRAVFMLQKEMAERVIAEAGSSNFGILSVYTSLYASGSIAFIIPPEAFRPRPRIQSAILLLDFDRETDPRIDDMFAFRQLVRRAFNQRRKTLRNSLRSWYDETLDPLFDWQLRPQALSTGQFVDLYLLLRDRIGSADKQP